MSSSNIYQARQQSFRAGMRVFYQNQNGTVTYVGFWNGRLVVTVQLEANGKIIENASLHDLRARR